MLKKATHNISQEIVFIGSFPGIIITKLFLICANLFKSLTTEF